MSWISKSLSVKVGDTVMIYNKPTGKWLGKPIRQWDSNLERETLLVPLTEHKSQVQELIIDSIGTQTLTTSDLFVLRMKDQPNLLLHVAPLSSAEIDDNPPERAEFVDESVHSPHVQWQWIPSLPGMPNKAPLIYGYPFGIYKESIQEFLRAGDQGIYVVADQKPNLISSSQEWVLTPTVPLYTCLSNTTRVCAQTEGIDNMRLQLHCDPTQEQCYDFQGSKVFYSPQQCRDNCFVPRYMCSGAPLYRCEQVKGNQDQLNYDQCILACHAPASSPSPYPSTVMLSSSSSQSSVASRTLFNSTTMFLVFIIVVAIAVSMIGVWRLGR